MIPWLRPRIASNIENVLRAADAHKVKVSMLQQLLCHMSAAVAERCFNAQQ
jgi:hypothetical protein